MKSALQVAQGVSRQRIPRCDYHLHTTWTDGENSVREMYDRAVECGLEAVLFSEHARRTSDDWFGRFAAEVKALPDTPCRPLLGAEVKVCDDDGTLDLSDEIRDVCDLIMASVHRFPGETEVRKGAAAGYSESEVIEREFQLAMAALNNPDTDILGHPFGMCTRRFGVAPPDDLMRELIREAARRKVAFEINSHYHTNPWTLIAWCNEETAPLSLGSNAHNVRDVDRIGRVLRAQEPPWTLSESS